MPDEFLTVDQAAQRLALPPEMIRRRIESGDIPVHWVEVEGKLEMRVASDDVGGLATAAPAFEDPYAPQNPYGQAGEEPQPAAGAPAAEAWDAGEEEYPPNLWTPVEETSPQETNPWEISQPDDLSAADAEPTSVPVWRPDPATWEDEPLDSVPAPAAQEYAPLPGPYFQSNPEPEEEVPAVAESGFSPPESAGPDLSPDQEPQATSSGLFSGLDDEEAGFAAAAAPEYGFEPSPSAYESAEEDADFDTVAYEPDDEEVVSALPPDSADELTPPSALAASQLAGAGSVAINSIDARELVAGLFERWERALEQRIQAEQRLRFEAELEQRLRQVRDLRQELDQTRKTQAAQMAEREREMMELRNKVRELEHAPKGRRLFRR